MTEENNKLRLKVKEAEDIAIKFLNSQPDADEDCNRHLLKALAKIADVVGDYRGMIEVECSDIDWDTDGEKVDLPKTVRIMLESSENAGEEAFEKLSNTYGWCIKSLKYKVLP